VEELVCVYLKCELKFNSPVEKFITLIKTSAGG
jgi:hypothetical protein